MRLTGRKATKFAVVWGGVVQNRTNRAMPNAKCESQTSSTKRWEIGASVTGELKLGLFASVNATISGSVSKEMTSQITFSAPFTVPAHTDTACDQGFVVYRWSAQKFDRVRQTTTNFTVTAPRRVAWRIKDIG